MPSIGVMTLTLLVVFVILTIISTHVNASTKLSNFEQASKVLQARKQAEKALVQDPVDLQANMREIFKFFYADLVTDDQVYPERCAKLADVMYSQANAASRTMDLVPRPAVFTGNLVSYVRSQVFGAVWRRIKEKGIYVAVRNTVANNFRSAYEMCKEPDLTLDISEDIKISCFKDQTNSNLILAKVAGGCHRTTTFSCGNDFECRKDASSDSKLGIECTGDCICKNAWPNTCTCVQQIPEENRRRCDFS